MEKSLVVQGRGLEDALDKAAVLLHCPKERVAYEVLQEPAPGRHGQPGVPCKLRVTPVAPAEEAEAAGPQQAEEERLPWQEWDLEALPCRVFLLSLQNLTTLVPRPLLFPDPEPLSREFPAPRLEVAGDLRAGSDPVRHEGDVRVCGSVRKGVRLQAAGSIHVAGDVETASLDAGGDIVIAGGLLGTARSRAGSVACKFAQGARLDAPRGDVTVRESAMHAHLRAGRSVFVGDILLGGSCYAEGLVETRTAGSESGVPTVLVAGRNRRLVEEIEDVRRRALPVAGALPGHEAVCRALLPQEEAGVILPVDDRIRLWRALMQKTRLQDTLVQLARQKSRLLGMINADRSARVCVTGRAHAKVKIVVDDLALELKSLTQYATFTKDYDAGELRITPYK